MQVMQLAKHLLLLAVALTASGAGHAAAQEFVAVPASTNCTANTVTVSARSDIDCAVKCSQVSSSLSYTFINGACVLSDRPDCTVSNAVNVFRKRVNSINASSLGYVQLVGDRQFWVFQQRQSGQVAFNRTWAEYEHGFGNDTEFWAGLQWISAFTKSHNNTLRVDMTAVDGSFYVVEWLSFIVGDASTNYTMTCGAKIGGSSNFSDVGMEYHSGMKFSTIDRDNDADATRSCSAAYGSGGFWYLSCYHMNPNGLHPLGSLGGVEYINGNSKSLRAIRMMLQI